MSPDQSPFLHGALAWLYDDDAPAMCMTCGYAWSIDVASALTVIAAAPQRYAELLNGRDGMEAANDGGWNATAYVWHLTDLARGWSERWIQLQAAPGSQFAGWDPDVLAEARNYRALPTVSALWALSNAITAFVPLCQAFDPATTFAHGDWGTGTVGDAIRWLGHEFVHHQLDVAERAVT